LAENFLQDKGLDNGGDRHFDALFHGDRAGARLRSHQRSGSNAINGDNAWGHGRSKTIQLTIFIDLLYMTLQIQGYRIPGEAW
jgi:hypothetical protein